MPKRFAADLFCGAGGVTHSLVRTFKALRQKAEIYAVNHWKLAIASHRANHPNIKHVCKDVEAVWPPFLVPGGYLDILTASPACTHHSKARGGAPVNDQSRASAMDVITWINQIYVERLMLENVPEWESWGPIGRNGRPVKDGSNFRRMLDWIDASGYDLEYRKVDCADYGDPQSRERIIIMAVRRDSGRKFHWPEPTHGPKSQNQTPYRTTGEDIIDWTQHGEPVGEKIKRGHLRSVHTFRRIQVGIEMLGGEPFVIRRRQFDNIPEWDVRPIDQPIHTVTANATDIVLIEPQGPNWRKALHRTLTVTELKRAMSLPDDYILHGTKEEQVRQIGNAVPVRTAMAHASALLAA